ncbi:MAG: adenine phosphoribosyltransferase [Elusimicrobia bacterium CG06_land_8_20_14_3_00_38_11]|nr:MAG: adenine phosphoribosyltransferase [Elusimicrobia bacterium CG06_land_8_20_14_3_00_38_11]
MNLKKLIRDVPDFPKAGIIFKDITPLLINPKGFKSAINQMAKMNWKLSPIHKIVAMESRGFIFGAALALKLGAGFVPVRKKGKLPYKTIREEYQLEYGTDILEMHEDAIVKDENVLIVDDVLATGGTAKAVCSLIEKLGGHVAGLCFLIELSFLNPQEKLKGYEISSLIKY